MQVLKYMNFGDFFKTFKEIYSRYRHTSNSTYAYFSMYPFQYIQYSECIQKLVWDDYRIAKAVFRYIDNMINKGAIQEVQFSTIITHAYFIFTQTNFRKEVENSNDFDKLFRDIEILIDNLDDHSCS